MKMILLIFVLLTDDRSIFTKFRHNLAKLSDEIINVTSKKIIPNSEIIFPLIYRFYTLYFRGHIIFHRVLLELQLLLEQVSCQFFLQQQLLDLL